MSADGPVAYLDDRAREIVAFAQQLIACPSENPPGDERAIASLCRDRLLELGIDRCEVLAMESSRPNLIARVGDRSSGGRRLIVAGHLDTKPAGDIAEWDTDPWDPVIRGGLLHGLGSGDMKAAVAAMVYAAAAIRATNGLRRGELILVLTADEEAGSAFGSRWLAESGALEADAALIGEPCGIHAEWEAIDVVSRGALLFRIAVRGTQMHSSISDRFPAVNATAAMARLIDRMETGLRGAITFPEHPLAGLGPTVNVGVTARAGIYYGVYPGYAEFGCDIRTLPGMTLESLRDDLDAFLAAARREDPELDAELIVDGWFPATEIPSDHPLVQAVQNAAMTVLGRVPPLAAFPGATDSTYFQLGAGIPTIPAFGPGLLPRAHSPNECLAIGSIGEAAKMYALSAQTFLARDEP